MNTWTHKAAAIRTVSARRATTVRAALWRPGARAAHPRPFHSKAQERRHADLMVTLMAKDTAEGNGRGPLPAPRSTKLAPAPGGFCNYPCRTMLHKAVASFGQLPESRSHARLQRRTFSPATAHFFTSPLSRFLSTPAPKTRSRVHPRLVNK